MRWPRGVGAWAGLALAIELLTWFLAEGTRTSTFAWFRISAHAGLGGMALCVAAGVVAAAIAWQLHRRPLPAWAGWLALALASVAVHLAWLDMAQGQPDTVLYHLYARALAADPLGGLLGWQELAWSGERARFQTHLPGGPLLLGLAYRLLGEHWSTVDLVLSGVAVALPLAVAGVGWSLGEARAGLVAGWLFLATPFVQAQSGWLLMDLPLTLALCLGWIALAAAPARPRGLPATLALVPALLTKVSASLFLAGPAAARLLRPEDGGRRRWLFLLGGLVLLGLVLAVRPPRWREDPTLWLEGLLAMAAHTRPALWVLALGCLGLRTRLDAWVLGVLAATPLLLLYAPAEHVPRYAIPLVPALALGAAWQLRQHPLPVGFLVGSGLGLGLVGYRPVVVHHQAVNLRDATRQLEATGVADIEVWGMHGRTTFPTVAVAVLVDLYAEVPVRLGGDLLLAEPGTKRHWWEFLETPPWLLAAPGTPDAEGLLVSLHGSRARDLPPELTAGRPLQGEVATYRASSTLLPQEVLMFGPRP